MIRIRLINEGRVVKQITSRLHEGVVLEQVKNYKDPFDTIQIIEGELSEGAKDMLHHVARKIIPAAMAAGVAMGGAGAANAQTGGYNPNYPGLNHSIGQHMADIFSPNYKEAMRQREYQRSTERQVWNAEQNEIRRQRIEDARARAGGGQSSGPKMYDQSRVSQDGKYYIIYGLDNTVKRIPVAGTEYMPGDSQRLPHYIASNGGVYYVRHPHMNESVNEAHQIPGKDEHYALRNNIWTLYDGDEIVHEYRPERGEIVGAKKLLARFDDEGYDVTHVASPMGVITYLYGKPEEDMDEGYTVTRGIDKERYQERPGLEGPFSTKSGKVVYYDKVEGKYYDPDTDMYIGHEDYAKMDEAAPIAATLAGGLGLGVVAAAGAPAIVGILGPLLGIPFAAYGAYSAAKLGMKGVEKLWDMAAEKLGSDDKVTQYTNAKLAKLPPEEAKAAAAVVKQIGESKQGVAEDATVGTIPANGTVGTSGGTGRTQFAPTGKTTNAKFNNKGQIELDTEQEDDGGVNLDADAVKQLQQAGVQIKEDEHSPVAGAITRRILLQRHDLLSKYGPVLVMQAIDEVADYVGDVEEIGSSDVSGWIKQVEQMLANNPPEAFSEGTDTLEGILSKFSADYAKFKAGGDIDENEDFFQALFDYYSENGEMPYGVQKARDGDPYEWITDRLDQESGVDPVVENINEGGNYAEELAQKVFAQNPGLSTAGRGDEYFDAAWPHMVADLGQKRASYMLSYDEDFPSDTISAYSSMQKQSATVDESDEATPGDQAAADQNIIMQIRKASDYEKPTRIELADGTESVIAPNIAKQLLAKFDKMKPESKALLQDTLNTEAGFKEILAYFGGGVREQAAVRASNIMQSAMSEAGFGRDAYQRDYDSSVSVSDRGADHRGLKQELAHEDNDQYRVVIAKNGKWEETKAQPRGPGMNAAMAMINSLHAKYPTMHLGMKWPNGKVENYGKKA